ncbi:unnamed protein product [Linum trigynum]|uniref:F-box domain-containing protein n=1 Tax=Linum trigynum TaxID=586398 RepID=A0AAV2G2B8_9ROSI
METRSKRRRRLSEENHIDKLGDDLHVEILIRCLPNPRSACRCKTVCKRWRRLISSPSFNLSFISHHRSMNEESSSPPLLIHAHAVQSILSFMPAAAMDARGHFKVLDCFKDLLLCGFIGQAYNSELRRTFVVCNPFTKQWLTLPLAPEKAMEYGPTRGWAARLVCEPRISHDLDLGDHDDDKTFVYSEYRFRVVILYQHERSAKLDLFCSESGEWTGGALVLDGVVFKKNAISCNDELFWVYARDDDGEDTPILVAFNPFRLDLSLISIDSSMLAENPRWNISVSQGALHIVAFRKISAPPAPDDCSGDLISSTVWRLEPDRKSWSKDFEGLMKKAKYDPMKCTFIGLHPEKTEIAFFNYRHDVVAMPMSSTFLSCDLRRGELELFAELKLSHPCFKVLRPRFVCWPTPIPRYEELRSMYNNGTDEKCLVQGTEATHQ